MPGEVSQAHAKTEAECAKCHIAFDKDAQPRACLECHQPIDADIKAQRGFHGRQSESQCRVCHRSEEHTSELQSLMRISYAVFCLKKKKKVKKQTKYQKQSKYKQTTKNKKKTSIKNE